MNSIIKILNAYLKNEELPYYDKQQGLDYYTILKEEYIEKEEKSLSE